MITLRTKETEAIYTEYRATQDMTECALCREIKTPIKEFKYWVIVHNRFPYDLLYCKSDMLVTKSHSSKLNLQELAELEIIKENLYPDYDQIVENLGATKTIPPHAHIHLLKFKQE
jgi:hypothetical protein